MVDSHQSDLDAVVNYRLQWLSNLTDEERALEAAHREAGMKNEEAK